MKYVKLGLKDTTLATGLFASIILLLCTCSEDPAETPPPPAFKIFSTEPSEGVSGDTIKVIVANHGSNAFTSAFVNGVAATPFNIKDSVFYFVIAGSPGKFSLDVSYGVNRDVKPNFFEILSFEFLGIANPKLRTTPKGQPKDSIVINARNTPKTISDIGFLEEHIQDGKVLFKQASNSLKVVRVSKEGLVVKLTGGIAFGSGYQVNYYLNIKNKEYKLSGLQFVGSYHLWKGSIDNYPENQIILLQGWKRFSSITTTFVSNVFLGGKKLKQYYHDPLSADPTGYASVESFAVPTDLEPGEYELTVFELDGTTPILPDSTNKVKISAITFCPENSTYKKGTDIKVFITPKLNIYTCYNCPKSVSLWDAGRTKEYVCTFKDTYSEGTGDYIRITPPADIPPNGVYTIELKTTNGYIYKLKSGCSGAVTITP